ncbi:MAG: glutathione S-transferase [Verrucomicrobia bacterium]|nr:glutathione S-transferase [Verrucomicrobiota bacterium]
MLELIQFPWSPFCLVQRRIMEAARIPFRVRNIPNGDRDLVWKLTKERYYQVPVLKDGSQVIFETDADSQVIAKYLESKFQLGLFPPDWEGVQQVLWRHCEGPVEDAGFRLNDIYWEEMVEPSDRCRFVRHKERKFGRGCLEQWRSEQKLWLGRLEAALGPCERMLEQRTFLLTERPLFVDFDLYGMLANFLYSGHYTMPRRLPRVANWHQRMHQIQIQRRT